MDPRSQLLSIQEKIAALEQEDRQLQNRRHELINKKISLDKMSVKNILTLYTIVIYEFELKEMWLVEFLSENDKKNLKSGFQSDNHDFLLARVVNILWHNHESNQFKNTMMEYIGKLHDRDAAVFNRCNDLLVKIDEYDNQLKEIYKEVDLIHNETEVLSEKFDKLEEERDFCKVLVKKMEISEAKFFIEHLKLIINDKLFWKDKGVGITESQRKEPASIGKYRKILNDAKLSDAGKIEKLQEVATKKMKEFGDKKMQKGDTFFKGNAGQLVEKKVYPLLVKLHEYILERKDHLLNEIQNEVRNTRPVEKKSPSFKLGDDDL